MEARPETEEFFPLLLHPATAALLDLFRVEGAAGALSRVTDDCVRRLGAELSTPAALGICVQAERLAFALGKELQVPLRKAPPGSRRVTCDEARLIALVSEGLAEDSGERQRLAAARLGISSDGAAFQAARTLARMIARSSLQWPGPESFANLDVCAGKQAEAEPDFLGVDDGAFNFRT